MPPWYRYQPQGEARQVLRKPAGIAIHERCCCPTAAPCCSCPALEQAHFGNIALTATISGALTGVCTMPHTGLVDPYCFLWDWLQATSVCPTPIVDVCGLNITRFSLYCKSGSNAVNDVRMEAVLSNLGCGLAPDLPAEYIPDPNAVATAPVTIDCTPGAFSARFQFNLQDIQPGGCDLCPDNKIVFDITIPGAPAGSAGAMAAPPAAARCPKCGGACTRQSDPSGVRYKCESCRYEWIKTREPLGRR